MVSLTTPVSLADAVSMVKRHLGLDHLRLATATGVNPGEDPLSAECLNSVVNPVVNIKPRYSHTIFGFTITPEAIVGPIIMLGARFVKNKNFLHLKIAKHKYDFYLNEYMMEIMGLCRCAHMYGLNLAMRTDTGVFYVS